VTLEAPVTYTVRVRYADTDQMGVVYHTRYLEWFESARTELLRAAGLPYKSIEDQGFFLPVIEAYCRYQFPVRYDEVVNLTAELEEISRLKIRLRYRVFAEGDPVQRADGWTLHCFTGKNGKPVRAPKDLIDTIKTRLSDPAAR
jgi:acyl-CoA thioester hydrolase